MLWIAFPAAACAAVVIAGWLVVRSATIVGSANERTIMPNEATKEDPGRVFQNKVAWIAGSTVSVVVGLLLAWLVTLMLGIDGRLQVIELRVDLATRDTYSNEKAKAEFALRDQRHAGLEKRLDEVCQRLDRAREKLERLERSAPR